MFEIGEAVLCIDASDLPAAWQPLQCGKVYVIRGIQQQDKTSEGYGATAFDGNIHKKSNYMVMLFGITNVIHPVFKKELAYADSRFEKIPPKTIEEKIMDKITDKIANKVA